MKRFYIIVLILSVIGTAYSNPGPIAEITRISSYPPKIDITFNEIDSDTFNLAGFHIFTTGGQAVIDSGTFVIYNYNNMNITLDSSNTSGFIINPEADSVFIDIVMFDNNIFYEAEKFGNMGGQSPPIRGHSSTLHSFWYDHDYPEWPWDLFSFSFSRPDFGYTDIVINEISAHGTWQSESNFIELYNQSVEGRSLNGWQVVCDTIYTLPDDAYIPGNGFYIIDENDFPEMFDLDASADNIYLLSSDSSNAQSIIIPSPRVVDQVGWSSDHGENVSFMRYPDGDTYRESEHWYGAYMGYNDNSSSTFEDGFPTRGAANRHESPGFVPIAARADSIDEGVARITWTDPIWDELFDYSVLVKSYDSYADLPADGNIIYTGTEQQYVDDSVLPEVISYYTMFAYSTEGEYSTPTDESRDYILFNSTGVDDPYAIPKNHSLLTCYPNPFNAQAKIDFAITQPGKVQLTIYDITGRLIETLADEYYSAGQHSVIWNAERYSSGIYFARLKSKDVTRSVKTVLMK